MPLRAELVWRLLYKLIDSEDKSEDLDETLGLVERELIYLEKGLVKGEDPNTQAFLKALLADLNPALASTWEELPPRHQERLRGIQMRALRLSLQHREGAGAVNPQSLDDSVPFVA